MSDANLPSASECDDELKQALAAAFGDEGLDFLDDDDDDCFLESGCEADVPSQSGSLDKSLAAVVVNDDDAPLIRYVKEISQAIYNPEQTESSKNSGTDSSRFVVFAVNDHQFGVPLSAVSEIGRYPKATQLPRTPAWLHGVANIRGQIISVTDLRELLNIAGGKQAVGEKIIVVHSSARDTSTAIVVDRVLGIRNLSVQTGDASKLKDRLATIASGSARYEESTIVLIEPDQLFQCADLLLTFSS